MRRLKLSGFMAFGVVAATSAAHADRPADVCRRWVADRVDRSEGTWTGNADACMAGDVTEPGRTNALKILNLYRFLAEMPEVTTEATRNAKAQECALMQSVNGGLSHTPPMTWKCYTAGGAEASGKSNISGGKGVSSMDLYMTDRGQAQMGHRRWCLANSLGPVGLGSATGSCFWNLDGTGKAGKAFIPWPPSGPVPFDVFKVNSLDTAGWTIQSDTINLDAATVTVSDAGQDRPVAVVVLPTGYGSRYAIKMTPTGWTAQAGHSYVVTVAGTPTPITYTVDAIDCATVDGGAGGTGGAAGAAGAGGTSGGMDAGGSGRAGAGGAAGGASGGAAGKGGSGGSAGSGASGGGAGSGTTGGSGAAGATGSGGSGASGGSSSGGGAGRDPSGGSGGTGDAGNGGGGSGGATTTGTSGSPGASGRPAGGPTETVGCACRTADRRTRAFPLGLGVVVAAAAFRARRRRPPNV
jgi:hypothetical protein